MKNSFILLFICISFSSFARGGQDLSRQQEKQEKVIRAAYKKHKVTRNEYQKLMDEQKTIKRYIDIAEADDYWSALEIKRVKGKLDRAEHRLRRYKNNFEE